MTLKYEVRKPTSDIFQLVEFDSDGGPAEGTIIAESHLLSEIDAVQLTRTNKAFTPPSRYTILQNNQGWWQILKRNKDDSYWVVEVPNCGSRRAAVLMLNALVHATVEGTPEAVINRKYYKDEEHATSVQ